MPRKPPARPDSACGEKGQIVVPAEILQRKGARTTAAVPPEVRQLLNSGAIETANLCEWLIVDHRELASVVFEKYGWQQPLVEVENALASLGTPTAMKRTLAVGKILANHHGRKNNFLNALKSLMQERSDTVRGWACAMIGHRTEEDLEGKLRLLQPLASDSNMGVREMAWMAIRPDVSRQVEQAIVCLLPWARDADERIRRFASEVTRPRGVWCSHIRQLRESPQIALPLLEQLRSDPSKYVRDSVGNWLNDASKTRPEFVIATCSRWQNESPTKETTLTVRRALRTLVKSGAVPLPFPAQRD